MVLQVLGVFMGHCGAHFLFHDCHRCVKQNSALIAFCCFHSCAVGVLPSLYVCCNFNEVFHPRTHDRLLPLFRHHQARVQFRIVARKNNRGEVATLEHQRHSWQQELQVTPMWQEKKRRLYDKNDFPIAECVVPHGVMAQRCIAVV